MKTNRTNCFLGFLRRFFSTSAIVMSFFGMAQAATQTYLDTDVLNTWNTADLNWDAGVVWTNDNDAVFAGTGETVTVTAVNAHNIDFNSAGYLLSGGTLTLTGAAPTITAASDAQIGSVIAGTAGLAKAGSGQLTLTGVNTYTGDTTINAGTLRLGDGTTNPTVNGNFLINSGGTLKLDYNNNGGAAQTWSKFTGAGTLALNSGKNFDTSWGAITFGTGFTGTLQMERGRTYLLAATGAATNYGLGAATKVIVKNGGHLGMWENGTTLPASIAFEIEGTGYGEGGYEAAVRMANGGGTTTINGPVTLTGNTTLAAGGTGIISQGIVESAVSNMVFGTGSMGGTMELRGANTYTGTTTVFNGTLLIGSSAGDSTGSIYGGNIVDQVNINTGKTLRFGITSVPHTISGTIGGTVDAGGKTGNINVGGSATTAGMLTVAAGAVINSNQLVVGDNAIGNYNQTGGTVALGNAGNLWVANNPGGSGSSLTISGGTLNGGTGTSVIGVRGSYTFTINGTGEAIFGTLQLGHTGGTNNNPAGRIVNLNGGALTLTNGILYHGATNNSTAVFNLDGGTLRAGADTNNLWKHDVNVTATIGAAGFTVDSQAFTAALTQTLGGAGGLTKVGSGTITLAGVNAYTGSTTVGAGTLVIPETTATSAIAVNNGASLMVSGAAGLTIGGTTPISSLTLGSTPGAGGASISFTNFTSNPGAPLIYATSLIANAAAAGAVINLPGGIFTGSGTFPLVWYDDASIGGNGFGALKLGTVPRGVTATLLNNAQSLDLSVTGFTPLSWDGTVAGGVWDINTTANWKGVDTKYVDGDIVVFDNTATGTKSVVLDTTVIPTSVTAKDADYTISGTGTIAGTGVVTKSGTGSLTLGTNNTYTGVTTITGGTLKAGHANALGSTLTGTVVGAGGALDLNGTAVAAEAVTLNGTGIAAGGALVNNSATAASSAAPITLATATSIGGSGPMTLSGDIVGTTGLTKVGAGVTAFSSRKSYTGNTVISEGTLDLTGGGGTGGTIRDVVTVNTGGSLRLSTGDATGYALGTDRITAINLLGGNMHVATTANQTLGAAAVTMQGGSLTGLAGSNLDFFTADNVDPLLRSSFTTLASPETAVVSGVKLNMRQEDGVVFTIADGAAQTDLDIQSNLSATAFTNMQLVKQGPGTMRISGLSTYNAPTTLNAGTLIVPSAQSSQDFIVADGTTLGIAGAPGSSFTTGSMTMGTAGATTLNILNFGGQTLPANAPVKVTTSLAFNGPTSVNIGGYFPAPGIYPLISYPSGGFTGPAPTLGTLPRSYNATLVDNPTEMTFDLNISALNQLVWNGNLSGTWDTGTSNWLFNAAPDKYQSLDIVVMDDSATGATAITLDTTVTPTSVVVNNTAKNYSIIGTGGIGGSGPLFKSGSGTLTLGIANTYTGGTFLNGGTLALGNGINNGSVLGGIVNNANLVLYPAADQTTDGLISGTGSLTKLGAASFALTTAPTYTGPTTITAGTLRVPSLPAASAVTNNGSLVFNQTSTAQVNPAGMIGGSGSVAYTGPEVAISTAGQFLVDDANSYSGTTSISNSRVNLTTASGLGSGPITVNPGGQLYATGGAIVLNNPITLAGIGWVEGAGTLGAIRLNNGATIAGPVTLLSNSRVGAYSSNGIISGVISGNFDLEILSQNNTQQTVTFSGSASNTYTGTTTVSSGVLAAAKTGGAVAIPGNLVIGNTGAGSVWMTSPSQYAGTGPLVFTGTSGNGRFHLMGGTHTFAGLVNAASTNNTAVVQNSEPTWSPPNFSMGTLVLDVAVGNDYSFTNGYLRNSSGVTAVTKNGLGRQTLGGTLIDHTGPTAVNAGDLRLLDLDDFHSSALAIASGATVTFENSVRNFNRFTNTVISGSGTFVKSGPSTLTIGNSGGVAMWAMSGGVIDIQGGTFVNDYANQATTWTSNKASMNIATGATVATIGGNLIFIDALTGGGTLQNNNNWGVGVITLGRNNGSGTFSGVARDNGGPLAITKQGSGNQTFAGVNTYTGPTRIEAGTLTLATTGSIDNTTSVTIASGAVFDVSATAGFTQATGKTLTGGRTTGAGNDIVGSVTTGGTVNVAGTGSAGKLTVSGDLSLSGGGTLLLDMSGSAASGNDMIAVGGALNLAGATIVAPLFNGVPDTANPYKIATAASITGNAAVNLVSGLADSRYTITFDSATNPGEVLMNVGGVGKTLVWSAASGQSWNTTDTALNWNGDADYFKNLDAVTFDQTTDDTGAVTVSLTTTVSPAAITVTGNRDYTISGTNGVIAGGGRLTKGGNGSGTAALTLANANSYSGGTVLSQGTLTLTHATGAGVGPILIGDTNTGAENLVLNANVGSGNFANPITVTSEGTGTVTIAQNNALSVLSGQITLNRPVTIIGGPDRTGVSGQITGNVGTLTFGGNRTTLDNLAPNDFVGNVVISSGATVQQNSPGAIPATATVNIEGTGQLRFNNGLPLALTALEGGVSGNNNVNIIAGAATTLTVGANNGSGVFNGNITTALSVDKIGTGTQTFGGNNSFTGLTQILEGTLKLTSLTALGGSTLVWNNLGGTLDTSELTTGTLVLGGLRGSQDLTLNGLSLDLGANNVANVYEGAITLTGADLGLTKRGSGDQTLGGSISNSWSGNTTIVANGTGANASLYLAKTGGAVAIPANTTVNFGTGSGQANLRHLYDNQYGAGVVMNFANPSGQWTRFDLWGTHQTLAGANSGNATTLGSGIIQNQGISGHGSIGLASITLNGSGTYLFNGYLRDTDGGANASRQFALIKDGTGTQTLTGAQISFTGSVTVNGGKLNGTSFGANNNTRIFTVNNTGTFELTAGNVFGGHNSTNAPTLVINTGGTVTNASPATNNALNNVILNGGTLTSTTGSPATLDRGYETYAAWGINGTVTSTGNSTITTTAASDGQVLLNSSGTSTTFNVNDGTLTVSTALIDGERGTVPAGYATTLIKNGAGTLLLAGTNTYSGNTLVNEGTLDLAAGGQLRFVLGATSGAGNSISGNGTAVLNGKFLIDTTAAGSLTDGSWTLENVTSLTGPYGSTFSVVGFNDAGNNTWVKSSGTQVWTFVETTGVLTLTENANSYAAWINSFFPGETDPAIIGAAADPDKDGLANGVEMVLGGNPATGMDTALLPTIELVTADPDGDTVTAPYLLFTYRRTDLSVAAGVTSGCETDTDLVAPWTAATGAPGVVILTDDNYPSFVPAAANTDRVRVYVPRGVETTIFGRLNVSVP